MASGSEKFCLRWNDFESNISSAFRELREDKDFFDVTLACDEDQIQAHKVILAACSPFFKTVLRRNRHEHPLLYLKGVKFTDLVSVLNFIYHGEVNVAQEELNSFLAVAEDLKVKGLTQNSGGGQSSSPIKSRPPPSPVISAPPPKRPRPPPPRPQTSSFHHPPADDDEIEIQEIQPIVKAEPQAPMAMSVPESQGIVADPNMEQYGEEYGEYEGYDQGDYEGGMLDQSMAGGADGNKDFNSMLESMIERCDEAGMKFKCTSCQKMTASKQSITRHVETHLDLAHNCDLCGKVSRTRVGLAQHYAKFHGDTVLSPWTMS